ncbi:uncharacterized protein PAC_16722 [Phialocephala subalpina]|uniref:Uncharacterized protein n=1 Tax=Phialocephala subalpina TaxID=576137 RepID=A0A1L7XP41_9HELO|nr:uncharacterized protein PAC_16722 [Phialocephala subalpina]
MTHLYSVQMDIRWTTNTSSQGLLTHMSYSSDSSFSSISETSPSPFRCLSSPSSSILNSTIISQLKSRSPYLESAMPPSDIRPSRYWGMDTVFSPASRSSQRQQNLRTREDPTQTPTIPDPRNSMTREDLPYQITDDGGLSYSCPSQHVQTRSDFEIASANGSNANSCLACIDLEILRSASMAELRLALASLDMSTQEREDLMRESWRMYRLVSNFSRPVESLTPEALESLLLEFASRIEQLDQWEEFRNPEEFDPPPQYTPMDVPPYTGQSSPIDPRSYQALCHTPTEFFGPSPPYTPSDTPQLGSPDQLHSAESWLDGAIGLWKGFASVVNAMLER